MQRRFRLHRAEEFARVRHEGQVFHQRSMLLSFVPNRLPHNRYGFITSKRLGNAVRRNRTRRLMREAVRLLHPRLRSGFDIVIVARPELVGQPFTVVMAMIAKSFHRSGLLLEDDTQ